MCGCRIWLYPCHVASFLPTNYRPFMAGQVVGGGVCGWATRAASGGRIPGGRPDPLCAWDWHGQTSWRTARRHSAQSQSYSSQIDRALVQHCTARGSLGDRSGTRADGPMALDLIGMRRSYNKFYNYIIFIITSFSFYIRRSYFYCYDVYLHI